MYMECSWNAKARASRRSSWGGAPDLESDTPRVRIFAVARVRRIDRAHEDRGRIRPRRAGVRGLDFHAERSDRDSQGLAVRINVNAWCNVVTGDHSKSYRSPGHDPAPEI